MSNYFFNDSVHELLLLITICLTNIIVDLARGAMHVHWKELEPYVRKYEQISWVLIHFSTRYKDKEIKEFFDALPGGRPTNIHLWIKE